MKLCDRCGSPDVAQSVWMHCNTVGMIDMGELTFYWCFSCNRDTTVHQKSEELPVVVTTQIDKQPVEMTITPVSAHLRETPTHHAPPKQLEYTKMEWVHNERRVRYWMLVKNARRLKNQEDVVWDSVDGPYVQVWKTLKPTTFHRKAKPKK